MTGKILIIEDEARLRTILHRLLTSQGHQVSTATNGEEGLQFLAQESFDLVITDVMMGQVSGFDVMEYITTHASETLVIVITGYVSTESAIEAIHKGAYDYLTKPFEIEVMEASVERALERVQLRRQLKCYTRELEKQAQELSRSEKALQTQTKILQESMGDGLVVVDNQGRFLLYNPAAEQILGPKPADLTPEEWTEYFGFYLSDTITPYPTEELPLIRAMQGEAVDEVEIFVRQTNRPEGVWVSVTARPLPSEEHTLAGGVAVFRDITSRKQRERELEAMVSVTTALRDASNRIEMERMILDHLHHLLQAEGAALALCDFVKNDVEIECARGAWTHWTGMRLARGEGISGHVMETGEVYVHEKVQDDPRLVYEATEKCQAVACVPLIANEQTIGALWIGRRKRFTVEEVGLLTAVGNIAANALHRVTLYEQTERRLQRLDVLRNIDMAITNSLDLRVTLNVFLDQLTAQLQLDAAAILLFDPHTQLLEFATGRGFHAQPLTPSCLRIGEGAAGQAVLERKPIFIPDLNTRPDSLRSHLAKQEGYMTYYALPLVAKGEVKGVIEIFHSTPLDPDREWLNFLESLAAQAAMAIDNATLFENLQRSNLELVVAYDSTLEGWSRALDLRDQETEGHTQRVTELTLHLARAIGIRNGELVHIRRGALLHDIGKMGIPDNILRKPGPLTEEEWQIMRLHPVYAYEMLTPISYLRPALDIPHYHHEKWDGTGYPQGLKGKAIPLAARIFAVVDVWDALRSDRPYRESWPEEKVCTHIQSLSGTHFDPQIVETFFQEEIWKKWSGIHTGQD